MKKRNLWDLFQRGRPEDIVTPAVGMLIPVDHVKALVESMGNMISSAVDGKKR